MAHKKTDVYFEEMKDHNFGEFIYEYMNLVVGFSEDILKLYQIAKENPSKVSMNSVYRMRGKTVDLEKFGKQFRKRTIAMKKDRTNGVGNGQDSSPKK